jgi:pimeloyl-ACP methyl ester carboxylesterase
MICDHFDSIIRSQGLSFMLFRIAASLMIVVIGAIGQAADDLYFDSDGVKIHYLIEGEGEPVILVHGFTSSLQQEWRRSKVMPTLSEKFQVIALDNRGHGQSDKPLDPSMYGTKMAGDVIRLMDHLKLNKAHLVGYSLGGIITEYLVVHHPERWQSATIGGMGWIKADDKRMALTGNLALLLDNSKQIGDLIKRIQPDGSFTSSGPLRVLDRGDTKYLAACARGICNLAVTEEQLKANKVPTLAIVGDKDLLKVTVDDLQKVMSNLTVVLVPGTEHESTLRAKEFVNGVQSFIAAHPMNSTKID